MGIYGQVVIVGVGLLGGSIGRALLERGLSRHVVGVGRNADRLAAAANQGIISRAATDLQQAVAGADAVIVCTPVEAIVPHLCQAARRLGPETWITDVGSTKQRIVSQAEQMLPAGCLFVGSHPLAGSERSGFEHARADLLDGRLVILTPTPRSPQAAVRAATEFWESLGSQVRQMPPEQHDQAMAGISHLPHLLASALAGSTPEELLPLAAGGWRDSTRIASGDVQLWTQILLDNRQAVLRSADQVLKCVEQFCDALRQGDSEQLSRLLAAGKKVRDVVAD